MNDDTLSLSFNGNQINKLSSITATLVKKNIIDADTKQQRFSIF